MKRLLHADTVIVVLFGLGWALSLPVVFNAPVKGLDPSWTVGLYWALARGLQFGKDIVFTYGPLGFLNAPYYVDYGLWQIAVVFTLLMHSLLFISAFMAVRQTAVGKGPCTKILSALPMVTVLALRSEWGTWTSGEEIVMSAILLFYVYCMRTTQSRKFLDTLLLASASILLAIASLIKYNYAVDAVFLLVALGVVLAFGSRKWVKVWLASVALYSASVFSLWIASGQDIFYFGLFVWAGTQVTFGYSSAMAVEGVFLERMFAVAAIATLLLTFLYYLRYHSIGVTSLIALSLAPLFVTFKSAFVRQDPGHVLEFYSFVEPLLALVSIVTVADLARDFKRIQRVVPALAPLLLITMIIFLPTTSLHNPAILNVNTSYEAERIANYENAFALFGNTQQGAAYLNSVKASIRNEYQLSPLLAQDIGNSSVDIFPWDTALLWAYDMNWSPRPMFQSYNAYTAWLDHINALHLNSPNAPQYILFAYASIDSRYPLFDEPETFRTILCRYQYVASDVNFALLHLSPTKGCGTAIAIPETSANMGDWVPVPKANELLFARVYINYSLSGSLANTIYKPAEVYVSFQLSNGTVSSPYRFVTGNAENGIFVSGYVDSFNSLVQLFQGKMNSNVSAIMFTSEDQAQYQRLIKIEYFTVSTNSLAVNYSNSPAPLNWGQKGLNTALFQSSAIWLLSKTHVIHIHTDHDELITRTILHSVSFIFHGRPSVLYHQ
jgi:hypothetical protein